MYILSFVVVVHNYEIHLIIYKYKNYLEKNTKSRII